MSRTFKNPKALELFLADALNKVIREFVVPAVVDVWLETQQKNVYDAFEPSIYIRRRSKGGLADSRNIEIVDAYTMQKTTIYVLENITTGAGDSPNDRINALIEGQAEFAGDPAEGMPPRPYTEEAVNIINSNNGIIQDALVEGFAAQGIQITVS